MPAKILGCAVLFLSAVGAPVAAEDSPILKLLKSGRVPEERLPTVIETLCRNAGPDELKYVFDQVLSEKFPLAAKKKGIAGLIAAATERKQIPSGDLSSLAKLLTSNDADLRKGGMELATLWKVESLGETFQKMLTDPQATAAAKQAALKGLLAVGGEKGKGTITQLAKDGKPIALRFEAIAALAEFDLAAAADAAHQALLAATPQDDSAALMDAFLTRAQGPEKLAVALATKPLEKDVAKRALRHMFTSGHSEQELADVLSSAAGLAADVPPPTQDEALKIAAEVIDKGDPARGEVVFRRKDVACLRCHAVAKAGGQVGPELTAIGSISPPDYIVNSILNPDLGIKEAYVTRVIVTVDGRILTGIVTERDDNKIVLKDANSMLHTIAADDIEAEKEGKSLMPRGLTKFLTHQEFLDLSRFVSELGKPGPYAIRSTPTVQRWRLLQEPAAELIDEVPNTEQLRVNVLDLPPEAFAPVYATAQGDLPLEELADDAARKVLILTSEIQVIEPGKLQFDVKAPAETLAWLGPESFMLPKFESELAAGRYVLTLRIPVTPDTKDMLRVTVSRSEGSAAQFEVIGGQ